MILCLGRNKFEGVLTAFGIWSKVRIGPYNRFIESAKNPVKIELDSRKTADIFVLAHCGAMGTLNRNGKKNSELETQIRDWERVKQYWAKETADEK